VLAGLGIAVVPWWSVRREVELGLLRSVQIGRHGLTRAWGLVHAEQRMPAIRLRAFARLCADILPPLLAPPAPAARAVAP
jgi:DNA-binding transcriptional LysR family regulator